MFVQTITASGDVNGELLEALDRWMTDVGPGAIGWLGTTAGVTPDGDTIVLVRFASQEEAQRNSARPEQAAWWTDTEGRLPGPVTFHDCAEVATIRDGGSNDAGFVQIIEGHPAEPVHADELAREATEVVRAYRPDVLGGYVAVAEDGTAYEAVYFTSEAEAREHEVEEPPAAIRDEVERFEHRFQAVHYHDLREPVLHG